MVIGHLPRGGGRCRRSPGTGRDGPRPAAVHRTQPRGPARTVEHDRRRAAGDRRRRSAEGGRGAARGADPVPAPRSSAREQIYIGASERAPPTIIGCARFSSCRTTAWNGPNVPDASPTCPVCGSTGSTAGVVIGRDGGLDERDLRAHVAGSPSSTTSRRGNGSRRSDAVAPRSGSTEPPPRRRTRLPTGPGVTPAWFVDDPQDLQIAALSVDEEVVEQRAPAPRT